MSAEDLVSTLLIVAPGFVAMKLFQIFATQWKRSDWEWTIWSIVTGAVVAILVGLAQLRVVPPGELRLSSTVVMSTEGVPERFAVAILVGLFLALGWRLAGTSGLRWLNAGERQLSNSAWDLVLDQAVRRRHGVEISIVTGDTVEIFYGAVHTFGRESTGAERWLYLSSVRRLDASQHGRVLEHTAGLMVHADRVARLRVVTP